MMTSTRYYLWTTCPYSPFTFHSYITQPALMKTIVRNNLRSSNTLKLLFKISTNARYLDVLNAAIRKYHFIRPAETQTCIFLWLLGVVGKFKRQWTQRFCSTVIKLFWSAAKRKKGCKNTRFTFSWSLEGTTTSARLAFSLKTHIK